LQLGLRPGSAEGAYSAHPDPLAALGEGRKRGREGRGRERGAEGKGGRKGMAPIFCVKFTPQVPTRPGVTDSV